MNLKSHIVFTKQQRYGVFLLVVLVVVLQLIYFKISSSASAANSLDLASYENELHLIDSLKKNQSKRTYKIYPFNPNYINDYKGYKLGMSTKEIDRLRSYRDSGKWINSIQDFKRITKVHDTLLQKISPFFKFPDWVTKTKAQPKKKVLRAKIDINTANTQQLKSIYGVGDVLSQRIIDYRNKYKGGFASLEELSAIYGMSSETINNIIKRVYISKPRQIKAFNINSVTKNQLVTIPYIDYEVAHDILEYRTLHENYSSLDELLKINSFNVSKFNIIKLYLYIN